VQFLGGALEPLFDAGAGHDVLAIAEAQPGAESAVLVPERVELLVQRADVLPDGGVVLGGEPMPELSPFLAQDFDLLMDALEGSHAL
jgi:hypothetical protein